MPNIIYSSYWGTYSRILCEKYDGWQTVELDLTPINPSWDNSWINIPKFSIRFHCTARTDRDTISSRLPKHWFDELGKRVGKDKRHALLTQDIMPLIDYDKYRKAGKGGGVVNLIDCLKGEVPSWLR